MASTNDSHPLWLLRAGLPAAIAIVGFVVLAAGSPGLGFTLISVALVVVFANVLMRMGIASHADRDRDERARGFFDETGHWPDEA